MTFANGNSQAGSDGEPSAAELADAEARLRSLPADEVVPVRPDWLEGVVAAAHRSGRPINVRTAGGARSLWHRLVAGVLATIGLQGAIAATAVTTAGAVAAVVMVWTAGHHSHETMSFHMAVDVLRQSEQPLEHRTIALIQVFRRAQAVVEALQVVRAESAPPVLVNAAEEGLMQIRRILTGDAVPQAGDAADTLVSSLPVMRDPTQDAAVRLEHLGRCLAVATCGLGVVRAMPAGQPELEQNRHLMLRRLLASVAE